MLALWYAILFLMAEHKLEFFFGGEWNVNLEFDAVWYRSLLSKYIGTWGIKSFDVITAYDPEEMYFFFTFDADSEEEDAEIKDKIFDVLFP